ncbi:MAG: ABC transporter substrate-binding protein, partial [Alphaproteobacteria bacterium]|nr:ABC transporter substrate-binding protein [Alphaproteobacteria bacterium]
ACAAAGLLGAPVASAQDTLKIGIIATLSGPGASSGLAVQRGAQIAFDEINASGGLVVGGKPLKITTTTYDDQMNPGQAKLAAERLINQDKVNIIFGPSGSPGALGSLPVTQPAKVLQFVDGYVSTILNNEWKGAYVFKVTNSNREFSDAMTKWVVQNLSKVKKVGMLAPNDAVGQSVVPVLTEAYKRQGIEVWIEYFERGTKEFTPLILRMLSQKVDMLELNSNTPGDSGLLVKQSRQAGFRGEIMQTGGAGVEEIVNIAGPFAEGLMRYEMIDETRPEVKKFVDTYKSKYAEFNGPSPAWYNMAYMLAEAIRRAQSLDSTRIRDEMEKLSDYKAPMFGPVVWTGLKEYGVAHQIFHSFVIREVKDGKASVRATVTP